MLRYPKLKYVNQSNDQNGAVFIELALVLFVLLLILAGMWGLHVRNDMLKTMYAAVFRALNNPDNRYFGFDPIGNKVMWNDGIPPLDVQTNLLDEVLQNLDDTFTKGSTLTGSAGAPECAVRLVYVEVNLINGNGTPIAHVVPIIPALPSYVESLAGLEAKKYVDHFTGKPLNAELSKVIVDPDSLPQFGGNAASVTKATVGVYSPYAAVFAWACRAPVLEFGRLIPLGNVVASGIFVPNI